MNNMKHLFKQVIYDMKAQPVLGIVSIIGTALAIMLIMVVVMIQQTRVAPYAPESNRDRFLYTNGFMVCSEDGRMTSSSRHSLLALQEIYGNLETPERMTVFSTSFNDMEVSVDGVAPFMIDTRMTDEEYWRVFDHTFVDGHPYTAADATVKPAVVVITESVSRRLFGTEKSAGREFFCHQWPMKVCGVVKDVSPVMGMSYAQLWSPINPDQINEDRKKEWHYRYFGSFDAVILLKDKNDMDAARKEIASRLATFDAQFAGSGYKRDTYGVLDQEEFSLNPGANQEPDVAGTRRLYYAVYLILLLVPAINLSSMTQSRLRRRRHEIGVRRAFGATRNSVLGGILAENLVVTFVGGLVGLILSLAFAYLFADAIFDAWNGWNTPSIELGVSGAMLFRWPVFGLALLASFILNLLSAGIPAWRASRVNPVEAINNNEK